MRVEHFATHIPDGRMSARDIITDAGAPEREADGFIALFGMNAVSVDEERLTPAEHLDRLLDKFGDADPDLKPDVLLFVHAQPIADAHMLPETPALQRRHPWLSDVAHVQELDQYNCAGMFYALQSAQRLMNAGMANRVLVLAGDSFAEWDPRHRYVPGCTLLGDAYAALLVSDREGGIQIDRINTGYHPTFANGLNADEEEMRRFHAKHIDLIVETLDSIDALADEADIVLPHNINGLAWRLYGRRAQVPPSRVRVDLVADIGHCCTTDPFLLLDKMLGEAGKTAPLNASLMSIGMGGFTGAARIHID